MLWICWVKCNEWKCSTGLKPTISIWKEYVSYSKSKNQWTEALKLRELNYLIKLNTKNNKKEKCEVLESTSDMRSCACMCVYLVGVPVVEGKFFYSSTFFQIKLLLKYPSFCT